MVRIGGGRLANGGHKPAQGYPVYTWSSVQIDLRVSALHVTSLFGSASKEVLESRV